MSSVSPRPNILLVTTDQQHARTVGALGNEHIKTPHLDRLVDEGVSFDRAYTASPVCSPSRSSILTGLYPSGHGCWNIGVALDQEVPTLSAALAGAGYRTALFGKAHFQPVLASGGFESPPNIFDRQFWRGWDGPYYGFERVQMVHGHADEPSSHGMHFGAWLVEQGVDPDRYFGPRGFHREGSWDLPEEYHYTRWTADRTIEFLEERSRADDEDPFFAWCSFQDPHDAYLAPEPWASLYDPAKMPPFVRRTGEMEDKTALHRAAVSNDWTAFPGRATGDPYDSDKVVQCLGWATDEIGEERARLWAATYYGMVSLIDHHLGRVLATLDRLELTGDTIVIFTSDHGDYLGNHGIWLKGPLHYEDVIRVPLLVRWPGRVPANVRSESLSSLVDLAPTLLEAAASGSSTAGATGAAGDAAAPAALPWVTGVSQLHTWLRPHEKSRGWCLVENRAEVDIYVKTLVTQRYKLNYHLSTDEGELYDLAQDPYEFTNLFDQAGHAEVASSMVRRLLQVSGEVEGPYPPRQSFA